MITDEKEHLYTTAVMWTGNTGQGTKTYTSYERSYTLSINGKKDIQCSSDAPFRGDTSKHNPEDLFLAAVSSCHMLWYLHLCSDNQIVVTAYSDHAVGKMIQTDKGGHFKEVTLYPSVTITDGSKVALANSLHQEANKHCFIANSLNFKVYHKPNCKSI